MFIMEKKKKNYLQTDMILLAVVAVISILALIFSKFVFVNRGPIYGTFSYLNQDGTTATIRISEQSAFFENVRFTTVQGNIAYLMLRDEYARSDKELDNEDMGKKVEELAEKMDYDAIFNGNEVPYSEVRYIEEYNQYYYYIYISEDNKYGLSLCADIPSKTLSLADMEFELIKDR